MKKLIAITILSIMFIITLENDCKQYQTQEECYDVHPDGVNCEYLIFMEGEGDDAIEVPKCIQIIDKDVCQYDRNKHNCVIKPGSEEPNLEACQMQAGESQDEEICGLGPASCYHYYASKDKCLQLQDCGYDEKQYEYSRCFMIYPEMNEAGCSFKDNKCISSSNQKTCYLVFEEGYNFCKSRNIQCSDLDEDSSNCPKADLGDGTKKCSYDASRSSGNKCFVVSIKEGCNYDNDNENKKCQGEYLSDGKICDLDFSANPVSCQKRNIQCGDFDGDENKCQNAKLPDKSKECSYNDQKKCVEKAKDAKCTYKEGDKLCDSSLPAKIKCELNGDESGCNAKNVECSDFEDSPSGCNDAILLDSNKKCVYDSSKSENKCSQASKECNDLYNAQECNSHKPDNSLAKCVWTNECKEMTCETTSTENCGSFKPNDSGKQCALNQDKTQCEEVSEEKNGAENLKIFLSMFLLLIIF